MKTRIFLVAMALVIFASLSFGQGFCRQMYDDAVMLTQTCGGNDPIPDGATVYIYWDNDSNGPDADDPLAVVGQEAGNVNYNSFPINGDAALGFPGGFVTDVDFCSVGALPVPARFYLRIMCASGTEHYVSDVATFTVGPDVYAWYNWTCTPCVASCTPSPDVTIYSAGGTDPQNISNCIHLCAQHTMNVYICPAAGLPPFNPANPPVSSWHPGCTQPCDDPNCTPGDAIVTGPFYNAAGCWYYTIVGMVDNTCFCFTFERFLAANFNNDFVAQPMDNSVKLTWSTSTETGLARFEIVRGSEVVGHVDATNGSTTHPYSFVDHSALNGTTYSYTLRSVGMNNDVTDLATVNGITPSFNAAVITEYALHQNFPNPFNPTTEIAFDVLNANNVTLKIYNAAGQEVATLVNGTRYENGRHIVNFDATNLTSGLYFYTVKIGSEFSATKKMLLVK